MDFNKTIGPQENCLKIVLQMKNKSWEWVKRVGDCTLKASYRKSRCKSIFLKDQHNLKTIKWNLKLLSPLQILVSGLNFNSAINPGEFLRDFTVLIKSLQIGFLSESSFAE